MTHFCRAKQGEAELKAANEKIAELCKHHGITFDTDIPAQSSVFEIKLARLSPVQRRTADLSA